VVRPNQASIHKKNKDHEETKKDLACGYGVIDSEGIVMDPFAWIDYAYRKEMKTSVKPWSKQRNWESMITPPTSKLTRHTIQDLRKFGLCDNPELKIGAVMAHLQERLMEYYSRMDSLWREDLFPDITETREWILDDQKNQGKLFGRWQEHRRRPDGQ